MPPKLKSKTKKLATIQRSVYFYRLYGAVDAAGKPKPFALNSLISSIASRDFKDPASDRYWTQDDGNQISIYTTPGDAEGRFSLATIRRSGFPQTEREGELLPLSTPAGSGLHEPIRIKVFADNVVGVEFNFFGPRPSRLPAYLNRFRPGQDGLVMEALLRQDSVNLLNQQEGLRVFDLQIRSSWAEQVRKARNSRLSRALEATAAASSAEVVGLVLRPEPNGRTMLSKNVLGFAKKVASIGKMQENTTRFSVKGINQESGHIDMIDLLQDQLVRRKQIVKLQGTQAVDPSAAFDAIDEAYAEVSNLLPDAAGITSVDN